MNLNFSSHADVMCLNSLHLKQRSCFEKICVFLLINRNVAAFENELNKRDLFSKKVFRKNTTDAKTDAKAVLEKLMTSKDFAKPRCFY